jgi:DNA primase
MAKIRDTDIDDLRERADIVEVISGYTSLKRASGHTFKGLCPFHTEKTPSFTVDTAKGLYFCFGCSEGGNLYHFVQKVESLPFPEAVEWLARKTGYQLHYEESRPGERQASGMKARIIAANEEAMKFWHDRLMTADDAIEARRYLAGRGFKRDVADRWKLGYAPGRDLTTKHLLSKGFSQEELEKADLTRKSERDGGLYDSFRQRIVFPTWNVAGDVVAFGARAMGDAQPKYLNTAETPAFAKSRNMFGLDRAKSTIARGEPAIVVEGYTDVIALHEAGIPQAVATNGVALAETHFELLKKFTERAVLMFDADAAGKGATERGFGLHQKIGLEVLVAPLPSGSDPADLVANEGPDAVRKVIAEARPLVEFKLEQTLEQVPLDTPESRSRAVRHAVEVLGWLTDPIARHEYAFMVARRVGVDPETVQRALQERGAGPSEAADASRDRNRDRRLPGHVKVEREALQLLLARVPEAIDRGRDMAVETFTAPPRRELFKLATEDPSARTADLAEDLSPEARSLLSELSVGVEIPQGEDVEERVREIFSRLSVFRLERDIKTRRNVLQEINPQDDAERYDELFVELVALEAERRDLLRGIEGVT